MSYLINMKTLKNYDMSNPAKTYDYNLTKLSLTQKFKDGSTSGNQLMHSITSIGNKRNRCR